MLLALWAFMTCRGRQVQSVQLRDSPSLETGTQGVGRGSGAAGQHSQPRVMGQGFPGEPSWAGPTGMAGTWPDWGGGGRADGYSSWEPRAGEGKMYKNPGSDLGAEVEQDGWEGRMLSPKRKEVKSEGWA